MSTKDEIQASINSRLTTSITQIEGGTSQDIIGSVSYELANIIDTEIDTILDNAFVTTADEEHLIIRGEELGIYRNDATCAYVLAAITNADSNFEISTEIRAETSSGIAFHPIEAVTTDDDGSAVVLMECLESGTAGNIEIGELNVFQSTYTGLENAQITNEAEGYDGYEEEDIESYRERILEYMRDDACNSNIADYTTWAKSVSGVKNVVVKDAMVQGAGNVAVYISAADNETVSDELIEKVQKYIEEEQIINANLTVSTLEYFEIDISADLTLEDGANLEDVQTEFEEKLTDYLDGLPDTISYLYISNLLFETDGVADVSNYLLNNSDESISREELLVPIIGEINLNLAEE